MPAKRLASAERQGSTSCCRRPTSWRGSLPLLCNREVGTGVRRQGGWQSGGQRLLEVVARLVRVVSGESDVASKQQGDGLGLCVERQCERPVQLRAAFGTGACRCSDERFAEPLLCACAKVRVAAEDHAGGECPSCFAGIERDDGSGVVLVRELDGTDGDARGRPLREGLDGGSEMRTRLLAFSGQPKRQPKVCTCGRVASGEWLEKCRRGRAIAAVECRRRGESSTRRFEGKLHAGIDGSVQRCIDLGSCVARGTFMQQDGGQT